jgi:Uma2 family endonuclease
MGVVTLTESLAPPDFDQPWTLSDLARLPDDGVRYEIVDGSLLVSPLHGVRHFKAANLLRDALARQLPEDLYVGQDGYLSVKAGTSQFLPDLVVVRRAALDSGDESFHPGDVSLVVEVLSPSNRGNDLVLKRHYYAAGGIPHYWIVDPNARTLTVFALDGETYAERAVVTAGETWRTGEPFPLTLDPADFL